LLKALSEEYEMCRTHFYTAVVTFGEETKVQQQLTKDLSLVRDVIGRTVSLLKRFFASIT
jgi:hypothetical protein